MKPVSERLLEESLDQLLPEWRDAGGWTYNVFFVRKQPYIRLSERVGMKRILNATITALSYLAKPDSNLLLFHDGLAAWRNKNKDNRGYRFSALEELMGFLQPEIYFRDSDGHSDNYNIIDETGKWMITFCHEDDWFLFAPFSQLEGLKDKIGAKPEI